MAQDRRRVVWYEGMALDPHHLQQWDRASQHALGARLRAVHPYGWGFSELAVDADRLAGGEVALTRARGVFPDGLPFDAPDGDPLPPARALADVFPPTADRLVVSLSIPVERRAGANVRLQEDARSETRYVAETALVLDDNTGADERAVEVARLVLGLRASTETAGAHALLPACEVVRAPGGAYRLSTTFVPPHTALSASPRALAVARGALELLTAKYAQFAEHRDGLLAQRELSARDLTALGVLSVAGGAVPEVSHAVHTDAHPEALFSALARAAGALSAYIPGLHPRDLPRYDHARPTDGFNGLDAALRSLLGEATPQSNYVRIPLRRVRDGLREASLPPDRPDLQLFLTARSRTIPESRLADEVPRLIRVASPDTIEKVLRSYTRALPVEPTQRLPVGLPVDADASYFALRSRGPFWDAIVATGTLSVFVPEELSGVDFQLVGVAE